MKEPSQVVRERPVAYTERWFQRRKAPSRAPASPTLPSFAVPRTRERPVKKTRMHARLAFGLSVLVALLALALIISMEYILQ